MSTVTTGWPFFSYTPEWKEDCERWRGELLRGRYAHWCWDWDCLPVDETTMEFTSCGCWETGATPEQLADLRRAKQTAEERNYDFWLGVEGLGE